MLATSVRHYRDRRLMVAAALLAARAASRRSLDALLAAVVTAQMVVAESAIEAGSVMLAEQGIRDDPVAEIVPAALAGWASDGRLLRGLLDYALRTATGAEFDRIVATQLQDVARQGEALFRAAQPAVTRYTRALSLPSCGRCVVLAGRVERSDVAFQRHPHCDCVSVPTDGKHAPWLVVSPRDAYEAMGARDREKAFTVAGAEAIRLGADPVQVVNARRGMSSSQVPLGRGWGARGRAAPVGVYGRGLYVTSEGVTRSGEAGRAMRAAGLDPRRSPRLMPESVLAIAENEADAVRLLKLYGYFR